VQAEQLKIRQAAINYWVVERGAVQLAGATTRKGAEAERDQLNRVRERSLRRLRRPAGATPPLTPSRPARGRR
jgi:hypothetical protein